ncbi:hypothetical protein [Nostoc sp.]|uniref:hypothetical protein n=1 Tax=Nostoc sp. TaxID=1180 RepID=UPI002FFB6183
MSDALLYERLRQRQAQGKTYGGLRQRTSKIVHLGKRLSEVTGDRPLYIQTAVKIG